MNKISSKFFCFLCLFFNLHQINAWSLKQDWTADESSSPVTILGFFNGKLISGGGTGILQVWEPTDKTLIQSHNLSSQPTSMAVDPILNFLYVTVTDGSILTFNTEYQQVDSQKYLQAGGHAKNIQYKGNSEVIVTGTSNIYHIYKTGNNGTLVLSRNVDTTFAEDAQIDQMVVSSDYSKVAFFSANPGLQILNTTVNQTISNIAEYSLIDDQFSGDVPNQQLQSKTQLVYVNNDLYVLQPSGNSPSIAKASPTFQKIGTDLVIQNIHRSIYKDQFAAQILNSDNTKSIALITVEDNGTLRKTSDFVLQDSEGKNYSTFQFSEGATSLAVGTQNSGQQLYSADLPAAAFIVPISVILGVSAIAGIALLAKGAAGSKGAGIGQAGQQSAARMDGKEVL